MWKDFFYYTRTEQRGIIALIAISLIFLGISLFISPPKSNLKKDPTFDQDYQTFIHSLEILDRKEYNKYYHPFQRREVILAPFDPNTADSLTFLRLGLPSWMAKNILRYRAKGGTFRKPEDFRKIYGLSDKQFTTLFPYIRLKEEKRDTVKLLTKRDTVRQYIVKYTAGTKIELNSADTTELKKIPGIGSGIAGMIVRYRQQLGGFYSIRQLDEIHLLSATLNKWFTLNAAIIRKIDLNKAGISRLNAHPYINFYQAKAIVEYRHKHGTVKSLKQLALYEEFTEYDLERIGHYISFD
jgi:DNA uptake protein ComE-like DNA-binding protein